MRKDSLMKLEDAFLEWQVSLNRGLQASIEYGHYDEDLDTLFLMRTEAFNRDHLKSLQETLSTINPRTRVSTIVCPTL